MSQKWEKLCAATDIPAGQRKMFPLSALDIIVYNAGKRLYASAAECPSGGESLMDAEMAGHVVTCRSDGYKFDLATGKCITEAGMDIPIFMVEVREGDIWVRF